MLSKSRAIAKQTTRTYDCSKRDQDDIENHRCLDVLKDEANDERQHAGKREQRAREAKRGVLALVVL